MKVQSSENKLVITEEFIFDQNKLPSDPNNHFEVAQARLNLHLSKCHIVGKHMSRLIYV